MSRQSVATVVTLSPELDGIVGSAVEILCSAEQSSFCFKHAGVVEGLPEHPGGTPWEWTDLEEFLVAEKARRGCDHLIAVLDDPIENNWFSHTAYGKGVSWITTHDWEFYSNLPVTSFVAYDVVLNHLLVRLVKTPDQEAWLMGQVLHVDETRECISDMCAYKPDISRKIRSGNICQDCRTKLEHRLGEPALIAIETLLQRISTTAIPVQPEASPWDFPALEQVRERLSDFRQRITRNARRHRSEGEQEKSEIAKHRAPMRRRMRNLEHLDRSIEPQEREPDKRQEELRVLEDVSEDFAPERHACYSMPPILEPAGICASGSELTTARSRSGLHDEVERRYPFPIAYCFRSMRAELNPTDRWLALYELYTLIIRYVTFVVLSEQVQRNRPCTARLREHIEKLRFGSGGDWGKACMSLLKHLQKQQNYNTCLHGLREVLNGGALEQFEGTAFDSDILHSFGIASVELVKARNRTFAHGFRGSKQDAQRLFEQHLPRVKMMLSLIAPLADFVLFRPMQIVDNVAGQCLYVSKILMGSNPLFLTEEMTSNVPPETVCQLLLPETRGETLSLHPWLHLTNCDKCGRDMVFIYDSIFKDASGERVVLREYPSNHEQQRAELCLMVKRALAGE